MAKLKTNSAAAKRFSFTKNGKIKMSHAYMNHILTKKSTKRKRGLRQATLLSKADLKRIKRAIAK